MFDKEEYREAFSKVTASEETYRRVLNMTNRAKPGKGGRTLMKIVLVAAIVSLLAVTASASESVASWFRDYFADNSGEGLTAEQGMYIEENEQVINEVQLQDNCAVELKSFITDGQYACFILGVTAPEGMHIEDACIGNFGGPGILTPEENWTMEGNAFYMKVEDDGDGKKNTMDIVIEAMAWYDDVEKPFDNGTVWNLHIEDLTATCVNEAYLSRIDMENGTTVLSEEEMVLAYITLTLAEGTWDYQFTIEEGDFREIEFDLEEPVVTSTIIGKKTMEDGSHEDYWKDVTITSVKVRSLGVTLNLAESEFSYNETYHVVMKDGRSIEVFPFAYRHSNSETPIVLEEVDYILLADGTKIPVPEMPE